MTLLLTTNILKPYQCAISNIINRQLSNEAKFPIKRDDMLEEGCFKGKRALITGGGTGIGYGISKKLSSLGAIVGIASRKLDVLEKSAKEISQETNNKVIPIQLDVRNPEAVTKAADTFISECGDIPDIVVNNAAGNFICPTEKISPNAFKTIVDIVLLGTSYVVLEFGKRMIKLGRPGTFLAITTTYTDHGSGFVVPSACAKMGVEALTESLASEWGRYGIRFNSIAPGAIYTEGAFSRLDPGGNLMDEYLKFNPSGRLGEVEEIANLATYLVSDYASWISGDSIKLDGGSQSYRSGEFNLLSKIPKQDWDKIEEMIRSIKK